MVKEDFRGIAQQGHGCVYSFAQMIALDDEYYSLTRVKS